MFWFFPVLQISPSAFSGLSRLRVLHLESNRLSSLSPSWLRPLSSLRFLYASDNRVSSLAPSAFVDLRDLRVVTLASNRLGEEGEGGFGSEEAFRGARALDTVDLAHNGLTEVREDTGLFQKCVR